MSGTISFVNTPAGTRNPGYYFEIDATKANLGKAQKRVLVLGHAMSGTTLSGSPELDPSPAWAMNAYGALSHLASLATQYRTRDPYGEVWTYAIPQPAGGTISQLVPTFSGPATGAGTLSMYVNGVLVQVAVSVGMTAAQIAAAAAAAISQAQGHFTTVGAVGAATFPITATAAGAIDMDFRLNYRGSLAGEATPAGVGVTVVKTMGTGVPDLPTALANVVGTKFDLIVCPWSDTASLDAIKNFLSDSTGRWAPTRKLFGHGVSAVRATVSQGNTLGAARNDQHMTVLPVYDSPTPAHLIAADLVGSIANPLRNDPSLPLTGIAMGWLAPPMPSRFAFNDRDVLLHDGMSTFTVGADGTPRVGRLVTTYQTNAAGAADDSYLDLNTPFQLAEVIEYYETEFSSRYQRKRLVADGTRLGYANRDSITPKILMTDCLAIYRELEDMGRVQDEATFKAEIAAQIVGEGRINLLLPITLANQLFIIATSVQFRKP